MEKILKQKTKILHIAIIIIGIVIISINALHTNIWFDEAYSVGMADRGFGEIYTIGSHDVHPILYYWMLKIVRMLFGNQIIAYKLLSVLAIAVLGILGYTHIRKDFGEKVGLFFSFFALFLPVTTIYGIEIRMYAWAMTFATIMAIYTYRIWKGNDSIKNWTIFAIFSLASAYIHYYGLVIAGLVNLFLLIHLILQAKKEQKFTANLKKFMVSAIVQVVLYIPWIIVVVTQLSDFAGGFWIGFHFPETLIELLAFPFAGNLGGIQYVPNWFAIGFGATLLIYALTLIILNKRQSQKVNLQPANYSIFTYIAVILGVLLVSLVLKQLFLYARYLSVLTGLLIFFFAYIFANLGKKYLNIGVCALTIILSVLANITLLTTNYDKINQEPFTYLEANLQEGDVFIHDNAGSGFVASVKYPEHTEYFWDRYHWMVGEAYKAFTQHTIYDLEDFNDYHGRIWVISSDNDDITNDILATFDTATLIEQKQFSIKYQNFRYRFSLIEKK